MLIFQSVNDPCFDCQDEFTMTQLRTRSSIHSCWHRLKKLWRLPTYGVKLVRKRCRLELGQGKWGFLEEGWDAFGNGFSTTCVLNDESIQLFEDVFGTSLDMNRSILVEDFSLHMFPEGAAWHPSIIRSEDKSVFLGVSDSMSFILHIFTHFTHEQGFIFGVHAARVFFSKAQQWHHATLVSFVVASLVVFHNSTWGKGQKKSGKSRLVKLKGYDNFNTCKLHHFVHQFCWIF